MSFLFWGLFGLWVLSGIVGTRVREDRRHYYHYSSGIIEILLIGILGYVSIPFPK